MFVAFQDRVGPQGQANAAGNTYSTVVGFDTDGRRPRSPRSCAVVQRGEAKLAERRATGRRSPSPPALASDCPISYAHKVRAGVSSAAG